MLAGCCEPTSAGNAVQQSAALSQKARQTCCASWQLLLVLRPSQALIGHLTKPQHKGKKPCSSCLGYEQCATRSGRARCWRGGCRRRCTSGSSWAPCTGAPARWTRKSTRAPGAPAALGVRIRVNTMHWGLACWTTRSTRAPGAPMFGVRIRVSRHVQGPRRAGPGHRPGRLVRPRLAA